MSQREQYSKHFTIIIVAEDAREGGGDYIASDTQLGTGEARLGGIGHVVASEIQTRTDKETRAVVLYLVTCSVEAAPPPIQSTNNNT